MNKVVVNDFIHCFRDWQIGSTTMHGTDCGHLDLIKGTSTIRVFFQLNGHTHYLEDGVTVNHVESLD